MAYTTYTNVQMIIRTNLATADITEVITWTDAEVDKLLGGTAASATDKERWSTMLAACLIATRDPQAQRVGDTSADYGDRVKEWRRTVKEEILECKRNSVVARG